MLDLFLITFEHIFKNGRQLMANHLSKVILLLLLACREPIREEDPVLNFLVFHHTLEYHFDRQLENSSLTIEIEQIYTAF